VSEPQEKARQEGVYIVKGVPVKVYLSETGDFRWIPTSPACGDSEHAKEFLEVLKKMPEDRRAVWASRLDAEQTTITCPIIREDADLCTAFDQLCAAYNKPKLKQTEETNGGEKSNE
jgi:hypothetical protein